MVVAPGFVDLHVHGGGGSQVSGETPEEVEAEVSRLCLHHVRHGTTSLLATTVSDSPGRLRAAARGVALAMEARSGRRPGRGTGPVPVGSTVLGIHLEGPWLAPERAGAHAREHLRRPDTGELAALVEQSSGTVRLVTFAPELPGADRLVAAGLAAGIVMSVGHTAAGFDAVRSALAAGASHVTHLGNAMAALDRRQPGPVAAALADPTATLELIADGVHVHPGFLAMVAAVAPRRMVAVTDATSACGMPTGSYKVGQSAVSVRADRVVLEAQPDTLAGSVLTMDRAVATLIGAGVDLGTAVLAATGTPAGIISSIDKGHLRPGADADVVVLDERLKAAATIAGGEVVWDPSDLLVAAPVGGSSRC